jgi:hypothetical protein
LFAQDVLDALADHAQHRLVVGDGDRQPAVEGVARRLLEAVEREVVAVPREAEAAPPLSDPLNVRGVERVGRADRETDAVDDEGRAMGQLPHHLRRLVGHAEVLDVAPRPPERVGNHLDEVVAALLA